MGHAGASKRLPDWLWALLLVALAWMAHGRALPGGFVWDDADIITEGLVQSPQGLAWFWFSTKSPDYWPVSYSTFWFEWRLWGAWATPYRVANLLLHTANALLVWRLLLRLRTPGAWLAAALFAVHPTTVESVAWILQRKTLLATTFALASLALLLRYELEGKQRWRWAACLLFALGMLSKSSIVLWPLVYLICRFWQSRRIARADVQTVLPLLAVALVLGGVGVWFQAERAIGDVIVRDDAWASRLALAGRAVWFYVGKALFPWPLNFIYPRWPLNPVGVQAWLPDLALLALFALGWRFRQGAGAAILAGGGYYLLNLVPALGFIDIYYMRYSLVADHWQYLSLPGLLALVAGGATWQLSQSGARHPLFGRGLAAVLLGMLVVMSSRQASLYASPDNGPLWRDTWAKNPQAWLAPLNLGLLAERAGELEAASEFYLQAIAIEPAAAEPHFSLGHLLCIEGAYDAAAVQLESACRLRPDLAPAWQWLGNASMALGDLDRAEAAFTRSRELTPGSASPQLGLARLYGARGDHLRAAAAIEEVIAAHPDRADAHASLAEEYQQLRRWPDMADALRAALRLRPRLTREGDNLAWANNLAWLLATGPDAKVRSAEEALHWAEAICRATGDLRPDLLDTLAAAQAENGDFAAAIATIERAQDLAAQNHQTELIDTFASRLALYRQRRAYRDPAFAERP